MKKQIVLLMAGLTVLSACASAPSRRGAGMDESRWNGDVRLYRILADYPMSQAQQDSMEAYAVEHMSATTANLADAAEDVNAPMSVRVNAIMLLAQRRSGTDLPVFRALLDDDDVRIRASAVAALREYRQTHPYETTRIARVALGDAEPDVQAQALQILGDDDLDLLREYIPRAANDELRAVARDLVRVAEERGAPLGQDTATGVLRRESSSGWTVTFTPKQRWPQWDAAAGTVVISRDGQAAVTLDGIEAVSRVLPVFFSADGTHVVYERARRIYVRQMQTGRERDLGPGVAPRPRPFTNAFVFLRESGPATDLRDQQQLKYEVVNAYFEDVAGAPSVLGTTTANASFGRFGGYSPARWMRVEDRVGNFYLTAQHMEMVPLPDPFLPAGG